MIKKIKLAFGLSALAFFAYAVIAQEVKASDENGEVYCLALNMYFEAGNQPMAGKIAVSHVVQNRVINPNYPSTICDVIYQAKYEVNDNGKVVPQRHMCQFSWFCDGKSDTPEDSYTWETSYYLAWAIFLGEYGDITEGSTHYHADSVYPYWADSLEETVIINNHTFYK